MKLLIWSLVLGLNIGLAQANADCKGCKSKLEGQPTGKSLKEWEKFIGHKRTGDSILTGLARKLCLEYSRAGEKFGQISKRILISHMRKYTKHKNPTGSDILRYLNKNKDKMLCKDKYGVEKNYMMYAFDRSAQAGLFEDLFIDDLMPEDYSVMIDVNAVSYRPDGHPETVLDYMDRMVATNRQGKEMSKEILTLREMFVYSFGGKKFKELPLKKQQQYKRR